MTVMVGAAWRRRLLRVAVMTVTAPVVACGGGSGNTPSSSPSFPTLTIIANSNGYTIEPTTLPAGTVELRLQNHSQRPIQFKFATPLAGVTLAQLRATVDANTLDQLPKEVELGFGWSLPPGQSQTLFLTYLASTNYVLSLISLGGPNSPSEAAQGFLGQFTVRGATPKSTPQPKVAGTLTVTAHSLSVPAGFGKGTFAMVNTDASNGHGVGFYRFTGAPMPLSKVVAAFATAGQATGPTPPPGPPPEVALGLQLVGSADPFPAYGCSCIMGSQILGTFSLSPGTYVALGNGYDPKTGAVEAAEGLAAEFTVT